VITNYGKWKYTVDAVKSVLRRGFTNGEAFEIIIVENGSIGDDYKQIATRFAKNRRVKIVRLKHNVGFAAGANRGVEMTRGRYVMLVNNDVIVDLGWGTKLLKPLLSDENVAVAGSKDYPPSRPEEPTHNCAMTLTLNCMPDFFKEPDRVFFAGGAAFVFDRRKISTPFIDEYFAYSEDIYLSMLARITGYDVRLVPSSTLLHYGSQTLKKNEFTRYLYERNRLFNWLLFFEAKNLVKTAPLVMAGIFFTSLKALVTMDGTLLPRLKAYWWIAANLGKVLEKRRETQGKRKRGDEVLFRHMTCRLARGEGALAGIANAAGKMYCAALGIRTAEFY